MKIRVSENELRFRLSKFDRAKLSQNERLEERIQFIESDFRFVLSLGSVKCLAKLGERQILVCLPRPEILSWLNGPEIEFEFRQEAGEAKSLVVLIEKDVKAM